MRVKGIDRNGDTVVRYYILKRGSPRFVSERDTVVTKIKKFFRGLRK